MLEKTRIGRGVAATGVAGLLSLGLATSAFAEPPTGDEANHAASWEAYLLDEGWVDVECAKFEEGFEDDVWVSDDFYLLVVLKYATVNEEFWFVEEDEELFTESEQDISHVIACYGDEPTTTPTKTSTPTSTRPTGPVVETDVPDAGVSTPPVVLGGAAVLAGVGLAAGARRRKGQH